MALDHLWAGWRSSYIASAGAALPEGDCVFCGLVASDEPDELTYVLWRGEHVVAMLNAYPYTSGHLMVMPLRHRRHLAELTGAEGAELWQALTDAVAAIQTAYTPEGINLGANLGRAAGAGIPAHLHLHAVPRWAGDTNFMTTIANARILPEPLELSWRKLKDAWPQP